MSRLQKSIVLVLLFVFSACSPKPDAPIETTATFTPYVGGTETALAVSMAQTQTAQSLSEPPTLSILPTPTPTAVVMPSGFSPVLLGKKYDRDTFFTLLGGMQGSQWLTAEQAAAQMAGASEYDVYTLSNGMHQVYGYAPHQYRISLDYFLDTDATLSETGMIGVVHGWPARQGMVEELVSTNEIYRQVVLDWLAQEGVADPQIVIMQIYRTDLEGDGTDEIFISSTSVERHRYTVEAGDYSMILMRKVVGNQAVTIPIVVDTYAALQQTYRFPCTYTIGNFVDLNRDGILEVMVEFVRWAGFGAAVFQVSGQNVEEVLGDTCITP